MRNIQKYILPSITGRGSGVGILLLLLCIPFFISCNDEWTEEQYEQYISFKAPLNDNGVTAIYVPYTRKDANGNPLTVTEVGSGVTDALDVNVTGIPGEATPDGNAITVNGAKFAPTAGTTYVFRYTKVAPVDEVQYTQAEADAYNAVLDGALPLSTTTLPAEKVDAYNTAMGTSLSVGAALTESDVKAYNATLTGHKSAGDIKTAAVKGEYQYKVIKVASDS